MNKMRLVGVLKNASKIFEQNASNKIEQILMQTKFHPTLTIHQLKQVRPNY